MSTHEKVYTIPQGRTHRDTATTIYDYLRATPSDWPNEAAARSGNGHFRLNIRIDGTESYLRIGELTVTWLDMFPNVPWSEDALSRGGMFTKASLMSDEPEDRERVIACTRTVLMRALRYDAKRTARLAEIERRNALADA